MNAQFKVVQKNQALDNEGVPVYSITIEPSGSGMVGSFTITTLDEATYEFFVLGASYDSALTTA